MRPAGRMFDMPGLDHHYNKNKTVDRIYRKYYAVMKHTVRFEVRM